MIRNIVMLLTLIVSIVLAYFLMLANPAGQDTEQKNNTKKMVIIKGGEGTYSHQVDITAYSGEVRQTNSNPDRTALMETPIPGGTCAVSRDLQKYLGMRVYIVGYGVFRVNDLMNERYEKRIDLFMASRSQAEEFGLKEDIQVVFFRSM